MDTNLFEALDNFLSCPQCNKIYKAPKRLPCSHIYCTECLTQIMGVAAETGIFSCPSCQIEVPTPTDGVAGIPDVPVISSFIKAVDKIKNLGLNKLPKCSLCTAANTTTDAESICIECLNTLCQACIPRHKHLLETNNLPEVSNLLSAKNLEPHHLERIMKNRKVICQEHKKTIEIFCATCKAGICMECGSFEHDGHDKQPITPHVDSLRTMLSEYVQKLNKGEDEYGEHNTKADTLKNQYIQQAQNTKDQITDHIEKLIQKLRQFQTESHETIDTVTKQVCKQIDQMKEKLRADKSRLANLATYISTMVTYGNQDDVTNVSNDTAFYDSILENHIVTHTIPTLDVDLQLVDLKQFNFSQTIGMLHYRVKHVELISRLVTKYSIDYDPAYVACMGNGNVVVCAPNGSEAAVFAADGSKRQTLQVPDNTEAFGIACTSTHIYLTDKNTGSVLMFNYEGKHIKSIPVGSKGRAGIAINDNQMYVTPQNDHKVHRLNLPDGDNKMVFLQEKDGISSPYGVAASSTRVAVASYNNHTVHVFNTAKKLQFKYGEHGKAGSGNDQLYYPHGVALDTKGMVILADFVNKRIVILSSKGEHLGNIMLAQDSLNAPQGICINKDGNIVVGCWSPRTIAVYRYSFQ